MTLQTSRTALLGEMIPPCAVNAFMTVITLSLLLSPTALLFAARDILPESILYAKCHSHSHFSAVNLDNHRSLHGPQHCLAFRGAGEQMLEFKEGLDIALRCRI